MVSSKTFILTVSVVGEEKLMVALLYDGVMVYVCAFTKIVVSNNTDNMPIFFIVTQFFIGTKLHKYNNTTKQNKINFVTLENVKDFN